MKPYMFGAYVGVMARGIFFHETVVCCTYPKQELFCCLGLLGVAPTGFCFLLCATGLDISSKPVGDLNLCSATHAHICQHVIIRTYGTFVNDLPIQLFPSGATLLHSLGARRFLLVLTSLLLERRVIMLSADLRKLTVCVHGVLGSLLPFEWQHVFIPLLPKNLLSYTSMPYPFLIGLHSSHLAELLDPEGALSLSEVIVVNLDLGEIHLVGGRSGGGQVIRDIVR